MQCIENPQMSFHKASCIFLSSFFPEITAHPYDAEIVALWYWYALWLQMSPLRGHAVQRSEFTHMAWGAESSSAGEDKDSLFSLMESWLWANFELFKPWFKEGNVFFCICILYFLVVKCWLSSEFEPGICDCHSVRAGIGLVCVNLAAVQMLLYSICDSTLKLGLCFSLEWRLDYKSSFSACLFGLNVRGLTIADYGIWNQTIVFAAVWTVCRLRHHDMYASRDILTSPWKLICSATRGMTFCAVYPTVNFYSLLLIDWILRLFGLTWITCSNRLARLMVFNMGS